MLTPFSSEVLWWLILAFIIAFILSFGIGANDVANSFGTSVGSGVLTLLQACWYATIFEIAGAVLIGYKVSDTMRKGILDVSVYEHNEIMLILGCIAALSGSAIWLLIATYLKWPISGTHSIVGSTIGFNTVANGLSGIRYNMLGTIVLSWFVSPLLSGAVSVLLYWLIKKFILQAKNPLRRGLISLPIFYGATFFINVISIIHDGPKLLYLDNIPTWLAIVISLIAGIVLAIVVQIWLVPWYRKKIVSQDNSRNPVKFTFDDSSESSPSGSPRRNKRPVSLIIDGNQLPAITETTELVSFTNKIEQNGYCDPNLVKRLDLCDLEKCNRFPNEKYKIDPKIIEKAENLLRSKESLDNTDLTLTSLNYIDEHNQHSINNNNNNIISNNNNVNQDYTDNVVITVGNLEVPSTKVIGSGCDGGDGAGDSIVTNGNVKNLNNVESVGSIDHMITTSLSTNSSKVPLIASKSDLNATTAAQKKTTDIPSNVSTLFSYLQILTAAFGSFAHGGNDVSNAIGPLIAVYMIYVEGTVLQKSETPIFVLVYGGVGISIGLWLWGRRVIETIGTDLTKITPSTGFTIEIGAAATVLLASKLGLPISTTHCKVGSVVLVGLISADKNRPQDAAGVKQSPVDWTLFRNIIFAWIITVPAAAIFSGFIFYFLMLISKLIF